MSGDIEARSIVVFWFPFDHVVSPFGVVRSQWFLLAISKSLSASLCLVVLSGLFHFLWCRLKLPKVMHSSWFSWMICQSLQSVGDLVVPYWPGPGLYMLCMWIVCSLSWSLRVVKSPVWYSIDQHSWCMLLWM